MADRAISELVAAEQITATDMFVLEQNGTAKKLTGQILLNWLTAAADGHGGIQSWEPLKTVGLVKTYRITLADQTHIDINVVDGRGIKSVKPTSTNGLVVTYTITYNDDTTDTFTVTNGAKGDKGDDIYPWIKYASQKPTEASHSFGDVPDAWIGLYFGTQSTAPADWKQYTWFQWKGEKGDTGAPATLVSSTITYQVGDSGTVIPSGSWSSNIPAVTPGRYLWTRQVLQFNTGSPITSYSVSRFGIDGTGAVSTVAGVAPDSNGNVPLTAANVKALALGGGTMLGPVSMNGQKLNGLNAPTASDEAATKAFVDASAKNAAPWNVLDNSDFSNPVNHRKSTSYTNQYGIDRWISTGTVTVNSGSITVGSSIEQRILPIAVKSRIYTLAAMKTDGTIVLHHGNPMEGLTQSNGLGLGYQSEDNVVVVRLSAGSYLWAALYEGNYAADNLPTYHPKGYAVEAAECQRYFYKTMLLAGTGVGAAKRGFFIVPVIMWKTPEVSFTLVGGSNPIHVVMQSRNIIDIDTEEGTYAHVDVELSADL